MVDLALVILADCWLANGSMIQNQHSTHDRRLRASRCLGRGMAISRNRFDQLSYDDCLVDYWYEHQSPVVMRKR